MQINTIGILGCGNIGADLCIALRKGDIPARIVALTDIDESRAELLNKTFRLNAKICNVDKNAESVDFLVECAASSAVRSTLEAVLRRRRSRVRVVTPIQSQERAAKAITVGVSRGVPPDAMRRASSEAQARSFSIIAPRRRG